jgi:hypothetical protein
MAANSVNKIIKDVVNNGGFIEANNAVQSANGVIILGGNSGTTNIGGIIHSNRIYIKGHDTVISGELKTPAGGSIETSGDTVSITAGAIIDAGKGGLWTIDPLTINISDYAGLVQSRLQAGTNVTLSTGTNLSIAGTGDINVDQAISWNTGAVLFLAAYRNINISQPFSSNGGTVVMRADMANNFQGNVIFSGAAAVAGANVMNGGSIALYYNPPLYATPTNFAPYFSGSSPVTGFMLVSNLSDLDNIQTNPNGNYALSNDIDRGGATTSIFGANVNYTGIFTGYDYATGITHTISNFNISPSISTTDGGFSGNNLGTIANVNFVGTITGTANSIMGGVVGGNGGTIYNVTFTGNVTGSDNGNYGGIVGGNSGVILRAGFNGTVMAGNNAWLGGIAGYNVSGGSISQSYAVGGQVLGLTSSQMGGLVGRMIDGTIDNSYSTENIVGVFTGTAGGLVGTVALNGGGVSIARSYVNGVVEFAGSVYGPVNGSGSFGVGDVFYNSDICVLCTPSGGTIPLTTAQMSVSGNFGSFDFTNIWTTNGGATPPQFIPLPQGPIINTVLGSGSLSVASSQPVSIYANGVLQSTVSSNASGGYVFSYDPNIDFSSAPVLATTNATVKGTILKTASPTTPITGLNITNNQVMVNSSTAFSNANLAVATVNVPYSASGNNLTLSSGVAFLTTAITPYNLNGNITTSGGAGISFGNTVSLGVNSVLTSSANIDFGNTVNGGFALTANAPSGMVTFAGDVGGVTPLAGLTVNSGGPITQTGFIKVTGASSFSAGANAITLTNTSNNFGGAVTLSNTGANDVQIYNNAPLLLTTFNLGRNLTASTSGGAITLNGANTTGGFQTYNAPVLIGSATSLTSTAGSIDFTDTVNGGFSLAVNTPAGAVTFGNNVGGTAQLASLTVAANGPITEAGFIKVTGASNFSAGANAIDLSNAANSFGGAITLNNTGNNNVALTNIVATTLATSSIGGAFDVTSGGAISQTGPLTVGGASSFDAGANGINLGGANNFGGPVSFTNTGAANNVILNNMTALVLGTSSTDGNLTVTSNGNAITQTGPLSVGGTSSFVAGAAPITLTDVGNDFVGSVTLSNTGANDVQIYNNAPLTLAPFTVGGNITVTTSGGALTLSGSNNSGGAQTYNAPIILGANTDLTTTAGNIDFTSTIGGAGFDLTTIAGGPTHNTQIHGDITNVNFLTVTANAIDINANVSTLASQNYNGFVTLSANVDLSATSFYIDFVQGLDGAGFNLTTTTVSPFTTIFYGSITGINTLIVNGAADINGGIVSTLGSQTYTGTVSLAAALFDANLTATAGSITFGSTVNAAGLNLTTTTTADPFATVFDGNVSNVNNLTVNGDVVINNAVAMTVAGTASFNDEFSGPGSLVITAANTLITENDSVGLEPGEVPLSALTINGPVTFTGGLVNADTQTYNGLVTIAASANPTTLDGSGLIHFANNVEGPGSLTLVAGSLQFDGGVGDITALGVLDITAPVTLNGTSTINAATENFRGPVVVNGASTLNSSGTVQFFGTVDGPGSLTVDAAQTLFGGVVGGITPLSLLDIVNAVTLNGTTITANQEIFQGPATIGSGGAVLISPDVQFGNTIMGPGALSIIGNLTSAGDINIGSLSVTGTTLLDKGSLQMIVTGGSQTYGDTVTLNNDAIFITNNGQISFGGGGLYGPAFDVTIQNFSHSFLNGIVGSVNVNNLTLGGTGGANLMNSLFNSLQYDLFSIGSFCVNGSCSAINLNTSAQQVFPIPVNVTACDSSGCHNVDFATGSVEVAMVTEVTGLVEAIDANGSVRLLMVGDTIFDGETIVTGPDSKMCFKSATGKRVCVGPSKRYKV